jgi:hypothetical protein
LVIGFLAILLASWWCGIKALIAEVYGKGGREASGKNRNFLKDCLFSKHLDLAISISYNPSGAKVFTFENWQDLAVLLQT